MVDIVFTVDGATATSENAVTVTSDPTYGDSWSEIVTIKEDDISASLSGKPVEGTYSLVTEAAAPDAGSQQYTVQFNDGEKDYTVCTGTVQIAQKLLTITGWERMASPTTAVLPPPSPVQLLSMAGAGRQCEHHHRYRCL